ncbi:hypothetical protein M0802_010898 [Mischocyttarus mexicanus]|nr:hypothetical protein M0802_010898 [Mischocyttarus mexicanus]
MEKRRRGKVQEEEEKKRRRREEEGGRSGRVVHRWFRHQIPRVAPVTTGLRIFDADYKEHRVKILRPSTE